MQQGEHLVVELQREELEVEEVVVELQREELEVEEVAVELQREELEVEEELSGVLQNQERLPFQPIRHCSLQLVLLILQTRLLISG